MPGPVAIVTDSTAYLPAGAAERAGVTVVPLLVTIDGVTGEEGVDVSPAEVARALADRHRRVTTSRPSPAAFAAAYRAALDTGASGVLSLHLSRELSGTWESAALAAAECGGDRRVRVLDTRTVGMGLGFPALRAAEVAAAGGTLSDAYQAACATVERTATLFYVDTLEHLRRGGRIGAAVALFGTALSVKPLLRIDDGVVELQEKVRTPGRGLRRLAELSAQEAGDREVDVAVHHLAAADRARQLGELLRERLPGLRELVTAELGAAVGAHVGPGVLGVVIVVR
ncbi:MAG: DegV family protein [Mycobacteriales bacterium]